MAIDPNIPLSVQQTRFGEIGAQGIQQFLQNRRQEQADERANALLQLKQDEAKAVESKAKQDKMRQEFSNFAINTLNPIYQQGNSQGIENALNAELERVVPGSEESIAIEDALALHKQDPNRARQAISGIVEQARFDKLIPQQEKGKRVNAQIPGKIGTVPAIESPQGFLLDPSTGQRMPAAIKASKGPLVSIGGENALTKAIGKKAGEQIVANKDLAVKASDSIRNANEAIKLLNEGVITGFGADFIVNAGRAAKRLGFDVGTNIENTQAFAANQGKAVLDILGSGALGSGTGISDNDRLFAKQIAAGDITLDEKSIRRIIALNAKVSSNVINRHNKEFGKIADKSPIDLRVELPEFKDTNIPTPKTQEDFDKLPSGTEYISPSNGQRYRKP